MGRSRAAGGAAGLAAGRQLGLLWGAVALLLVSLSPWAGTFARSLPACALRTFTGLPCPTCGTTTAALALARFDFISALAASPLATVAWVAVVAGGLVAGVAALAGRSVPEPRLAIGGRLAVVLLVAANWAYLVWRAAAE